MKDDIRPPKIACRVLNILSRPGNESGVCGDIEEEYTFILAERGKFRAHIWIFSQIVVPLICFFGSYLLWSAVMIRNYMKIAARNLLRYKGYSFINITGLVTGITCFILIQLWIDNELSYDTYHEKSGRIYRVATEALLESTVIASASTPSVIATTLLDEYPGVLEAARIRDFSPVLVSQGEKNFLETRVYAADNSVFDVFTFDFIEGGGDNVLAEPYTVVITKSIAGKYFGAENPVNKVVNVDNTDYRVTGIIGDMQPNSHFHADFILSGSSFDYFESDNWWTSYVNTYIVLEDGYPYKEFDEKLAELVFKYRNPGRVWTADKYWKWYLQPLTDIHLHSNLSGEFEANGNIAYVYLFSVISFIILLLACFNFINLTTARTSIRAKEIGVRKVVGSDRVQLMSQFFSETVFLCTLSTAIAFLVLKAILPYFNNYLGRQLSLPLGDPAIWLYAAGFVLLLSIFSGSYPAVFLSSLMPTQILKGGSSGSRKNTILRNGLVLFQFSISIILIIGVIVVERQLDFIRNMQLGFDKEQVVLVENAQLLGGSITVFKEELLKSPSIVNVSVTGAVPGRYYELRGVNYEPRKEVALDLGWTDENFLATLNIEMKEGRFFSKEFPSDTAAIVLNESAARFIGWEDPLGRPLDVKSIGIYRIIGIVKDHHYESKHDKIRPMALMNINQKMDSAQYVAIKITTGDVTETLQMIEASWKGIAPGMPYQYCFLDEDYARLYKSEEQTGEVFSFFCMLALLIGALGLFGLASFVVENRTKEVGIRKAIGATERNILYILMKQFIIWPIVAAIFAWPLGWMLMNQWLRNFEYRITIGIDVLFLAGIIAILTAVISVIFQSLKAAGKNPVDSLRYE